MSIMPIKLEKKNSWVGGLAKIEKRKGKKYSIGTEHILLFASDLAPSSSGHVGLGHRFLSPVAQISAHLPVKYHD